MDAQGEEILRWCREYVADLVQLPLEQVDPDADFDRLGIDSALAVSLLVEVEDRYGVELTPEDLFEHPTLAAVAAHVQAQSPRTPA